MITTITVRTAVARFEFTPSIPTFAKIEVRAANIAESKYGHSRADFIAKLEIALKEANETGYWLELLFKTNYITENQYKELDAVCVSLRAMLVASINTAKENM